MLTSKFRNIHLTFNSFFFFTDVTGSLIGKQAPISNHKETNNVPIKKTVEATGVPNGFWNLSTFSIKGIVVINPNGAAAIAKTPNNLFGSAQNKLKKLGDNTIQVKFVKESQMG